MRLADNAVDLQGLPLVRSVQVEQRPVHYGPAEIQAAAAVAEHVHVHGEQLRLPALHHRRGLVPGHEGVALPRCLHVHVPVQRYPNGPPRDLGSDGTCGRNEDAPRLLSSKTSSHSLHLADDLVGWYSGGGGAEHLGLRRGLTAGVNDHAFLFWYAHGGVALQVEMLLPSDSKGPLDSHRPRRFQGSLDVAALDRVVRRGVEGSCLDGLVDAHDDVVVVVLVLHLDRPGRLLGDFESFRTDQAEDHADVPDPLGAEDLLVLHDRPQLVVATRLHQVLVQDDFDDAFHFLGHGGVNRLDVAPRHRGVN
mmetsp:Transcript_6279/g.11396  ORF Transcript_6279/g.11396 Transcript_6279/m.11396 type:complete len:307 (+) Transcript_6279:1610-2530(+)